MTQYKQPTITDEEKRRAITNDALMKIATGKENGVQYSGKVARDIARRACVELGLRW